DISERKRLERELSASEQKYRAIFEHAGDAIVVYDTKGAIRGLNRRAEEMFGYKAEEVVGRHWECLMPPAESATAHEARREAERLVAEAVRRGSYQGQEMVSYISKDGRPLLGESTGAVIRDQQEKVVGFVSIFRDISERKRLEREREEYARRLEAKIEEVERTRGELEEAQEQLVASERMAAIGKLASMVSHELRNPLGVIGNSAYYLKMKLGDGEEKVKSHLDILEREVAICSRIIGELLDFGRPAKPALGEADINSIVEQTLSCCQVPSNVELVTELGEGLPKVMADKDQMQQVFHNLLLNAAQAMPQGGRLTVRTAHRDNLVQAEFADTGIGIPRDNLTRIFQPLFSTKAKGTGLGLAVTESILDRHGGTIEVESEEGKGTTFTVSLPVLQAGEAKP
ncbi:MAG: ATP-binding protein, partial [Dehalococcoidia bacterium]